MLEAGRRVKATESETLEVDNEWNQRQVSKTKHHSIHKELRLAFKH
jgi:hypothetical protein